MRYSLLALVAVVLVGSTLDGQQPSPVQQPAVVSQPDPRLDAYLRQWEERMKGIESLRAKVSRQEENRVFNTVENYDGEASFLRPNRAILELRKRDNANVFEKFICTGNFLYEFNQAKREIRVHELPPPKNGKAVEDNFLSFLFGMKAEEAKSRYNLSVYKLDPNYIYLKIEPISAADKVDFKVAYLALNNATFLPRTLVFDQPNGNRVKWDLPAIDTTVQLNPALFGKPKPEQGWTVKNMPRQELSTRSNQPPPRVVRPQQK